MTSSLNVNNAVDIFAYYKNKIILKMQEVFEKGKIKYPSIFTEMFYILELSAVTGNFMRCCCMSAKKV